MEHLASDQLIVEIWVYSLVLLAGPLVIGVFWLYLCDKLQTKQVVHHNFPGICRLRHVFEHWGPFFRQYCFLQDREELPFNRAQRNWVYKAAKNLDTTTVFGSSHNLKIPGTIYFANGLYPALEHEPSEASVVIVGPDTQHPYHWESFFHISAMSYGAISVPAVKALSRGANMAGSWLNTGEGGLTPYHLEGGCDIVFQIGTGKFGVRGSDGKLSIKDWLNWPPSLPLECLKSNSARAPSRVKVEYYPRPRSQQRSLVFEADHQERPRSVPAGLSR